MRRVAITGAGPVSAIGTGREAFGAGVGEGRRGIGPVAGFDASPYGCRLAAQIGGFAVEHYVESQKTYLDRSSALALAALSLAIRDSGLSREAVSRAGLAVGSAYGSLETMGIFYEGLLAKGPRLVKPVLFPHVYSNTAISLLAIEYAIRGYHLNFSSGWTSAACALAAAYDAVRQGKADVMFAGGYEAFSELLLAGLDASGRLSACDEGAGWPGPLDADRDGALPGEGAAILALEAMDHAVARGARILGEVLGAGLFSEPMVERELTDGAGIAEAMRRAAPDGGAGAVFASADGSPAMDANEAVAIAAFLGADAAATPVTALKAMTGETFGAAGALQAIAALGALESGRVPAIAGLAGAGEGERLNLVRGAPQALAGPRRVLVNSIDPGGAVACLLIGAWEGQA